MADITIEPLTQQNKLQALAIILITNVGPKTRALRFLNQSLRRKRNNIFLAVHRARPIGIIGWYKDDGTWAGRSLEKLFPYGKDIYWVSYFAVRSTYRNKGIGTRLMRFLQKEIRKYTPKELWTYTRRARGFYEKMDFQFVTRTKIEHSKHDFLKYSYNYG